MHRRLLISLLILWAATSSVFAAELSQLVPPYNMEKYDNDIARLYKILTANDNKPIAKRITTISQYFMDKPYLLGPLGEGSEGEYDQNPLYRTDAFDCVTYVSTVVALAAAKDLPQFKQAIKAVNYQDGQPRFRYRNHFMELDWNRNNQRKGYVTDITDKILDAKGQPIAVIANATIDKPNWYKNFKASQLKLLKTLTPEQTTELLSKLRAESKHLQITQSTIPYLPLTKLFTDGKPNENIFAQIPTGTIIEIVRPNWQLKKLIGTNMNVSHLGLAIRTPEGLMFREASSEEHKVIDIPLTQYLKKYLASPTIKGINVQAILEKK
ncbi:DUF1460 domain-containing protein [soil metagenome]